MNYSRKYIETLNKDNNFIQNNLEKVVRLLDSNGNFIENDKGIPVDYEIAESLWYNRIALNAELDKLTQ